MKPTASDKRQQKIGFIYFCKRSYNGAMQKGLKIK